MVGLEETCSMLDLKGIFYGNKDLSVSPVLHIIEVLNNFNHCLFTLLLKCDTNFKCYPYCNVCTFTLQISCTFTLVDIITDLTTACTRVFAKTLRKMVSLLCMDHAVHSI